MNGRTLNGAYLDIPADAGGGFAAGGESVVLVDLLSRLGVQVDDGSGGSRTIHSVTELLHL